MLLTFIEEGTVTQGRAVLAFHGLVTVMHHEACVLMEGSHTPS